MFTEECKQTVMALYFYKLAFCQDIWSFVIYVYKKIFRILMITSISVSIDTHMQPIKLATINFTSHVKFSLIMTEI